MKKFAIGLLVFAALFFVNTNIGLAQEEIIQEEEELIQEEEQPKEEQLQEEEVIEADIQDEGELSKSAVEKYYKEKYEQTFDYPFEVVWEAIKLSLQEKGYQVAYEKYSQTDEGLYKGSIKSDYCVFSAGDDTTFATLKKYSYEVPFIRGGIWLNGRMEYKFKLKENDDGSVYVRLKGKISGFEDFVTHEVHFWKSNGIFETRMMKNIERNCKKLNE